LLPVFGLFLPIDIAVMATAVVHLANNLFKASLVWPDVRWSVLWRFALPAIPAAYGGAVLLTHLDTLQTGAAVGGFQLNPVKATIRVLMIMFALVELMPRFKSWEVDPKWVPLGGVLSGFFGGL